MQQYFKQPGNLSIPNQKISKPFSKAIGQGQIPHRNSYIKLVYYPIKNLKGLGIYHHLVQSLIQTYLPIQKNKRF